MSDTREPPPATPDPHPPHSDAAVRSAPVSAMAAPPPLPSPPPSPPPSPVETAPGASDSVPDQSLAKGTSWVMWLIAALALLAAIGLWYSSRPEAVPLQGTVEAREVNVATRALARVVRIGPEEGAMVRAGDVLAQLSSPLREAAVAQGEAQLESARQMDALVAAGARGEDVDTLRGTATAAQAAANLASVTAGRMRRLYAQGVVSAQRRDEAVAAERVAVANAAAAGAQYRKALAGRRSETQAIADIRARAAQDRLDTARALAGEEIVVAPVTGEVARRLVEAGEVVAPGVPLFRIVDVAHPHVTLRVSERDYAGMKKGRVLSGRIPALGDAAVRFRVTAIAAQAGFTAERATRQSAGFDARSFEVKLEPLARARDLRPGMSVLFDWPQ